IVTSVEVIYPGGTSADDGVTLSVGVPGALGFVWSITSEKNKATGSRTLYAQTGTPNATNGLLYQNPLASTTSLVARCAGGKVGANKAVMIVHVADLAS